MPALFNGCIALGCGSGVLRRQSVSIIIGENNQKDMVLQLGSITYPSNTLHPGNCTIKRVASILVENYNVSESGESLILQPRGSETREYREINVNLQITPDNITLSHTIVILDPSHSFESLLGECNQLNRQLFLFKAAVTSQYSSNGPHTVFVSSTISLQHGCSFSTLTSRLDEFYTGIKNKVYPFLNRD